MNESPVIKPQSAVDRPKSKKRSSKKTASMTVLTILMEYRESWIYQWVKRNPGIALMIVSLWGIMIIGFFIWFIISQVVVHS